MVILCGRSHDHMLQKHYWKTRPNAATINQLCNTKRPTHSSTLFYQPLNRMLECLKQWNVTSINSQVMHSSALRFSRGRRQPLQNTIRKQTEMLKISWTNYNEIPQNLCKNAPGHKNNVVPLTAWDLFHHSFTTLELETAKILETLNVQTHLKQIVGLWQWYTHKCGNETVETNKFLKEKCKSTKKQISTLKWIIVIQKSEHRCINHLCSFLSYQNGCLL